MDFSLERESKQLVRSLSLENCCKKKQPRNFHNQFRGCCSLLPLDLKRFENYNKKLSYMRKNSHGTLANVTPNRPDPGFINLAEPIIVFSRLFLICLLKTETVPFGFIPYSAVMHFPPKVKMNGYFFTNN